MTESVKYRSVETISKGQSMSDGQGVKLTRVLGHQQLMQVDPFLLLDEFRSDNSSDYIGGFPDHPHRGFQTVTYMLEGRMRHKDNKGHEGVLTSGGIQWMNAGRGIVHSEMPEQESGLLHGFQLWINLPAAEKMSEPFYAEYSAEHIPTIEEEGKCVRVIAGRVGEVTGPIKGINGDPLYLDVELAVGQEFIQSLPEDHAVALVCFEGVISVGKTTLERMQLAVLSEGNAVQIKTEKDGGRCLLLSCAPINETVVRHGPFVMNTREEINQAVRDYQAGNF